MTKKKLIPFLKSKQIIHVIFKLGVFINYILFKINYELLIKITFLCPIQFTSKRLDGLFKL